MSIYMICNREVYREGETERFKSNGKEDALSTFRIARCALPTEEGVSEVSYEILQDKFHSGYDDVAAIFEGRSPSDSLMGTAQVFHDLYDQMVTDDSNKGDVLFFIHGFSTGFDATLKHIYDLHELYIKPAHSPIKHMIYVSWPSRNSKVLTYWDDQDDAEETGRLLGRVYTNLHRFFLMTFEKLKRDRCKHKIHLAAHSMGCTVLREMLEAIPQNRLFPLFGEVVLLHSDVENDVFEEGRPYTKLEALAERTHIYIHRSDDALRISRFTKNFNKRLGFKGPKNKYDLNDETFIVDTTEASNEQVPYMERSIDHWGYLYRFEVINHVLAVFNGTETEAIKHDREHSKFDQYYIL